MKIGIDASRAFVDQRTGIEEYSYQVIKNLMGYLKDHQVVLYIRSGQESMINEQKFYLPENWETRVISMPRLWTQIGLSLEMLFHPVDTLFIPAHVIPLIHPKKTVVTVHGLEFEIFPGCYSFLARLYMRWSIKFSCRAAKKIIAVSENTKNDLVRLYKVPAEKIKVINNGANIEQKMQDGEQHDRHNPYLLFIGRLEKRKNIEGIIAAYEILKEKYKIPHKLILVGKPGHDYESIRHKVLSIKFKEDIILPGFVCEEEKRKLLCNADVFLFPTLYEGFGLPILEAQSVGVPVITSDISSLTEVGGDSVIYCDPKRPGSIAEATFGLISNVGLKDDIIKKGYENIGRFSWKNCSFKVSKIIKDEK